MKETQEYTELENRVWEDIARARRSLALLEIFIKGLDKHASAHDKNKYSPLTIAIWWAAMDSLVSALGRLLGTIKTGEECTLPRFRNLVLKLLHNTGPKRSVSDYSKECIKKLRDKEFLRDLKSKQNIYTKEIMLWRNGMVAHSLKKANLALPKDLPLIVNYVEEVHRVCLSAYLDIGMPGPYLSPKFKDVSDEWIDLLVNKTGK